jgi:hypothetical protein
MARLPYTFFPDGAGASCTPARDDLPDIRQGLADRAVDLFERLWGRKGSLALYLRGRNGPRWHCYESGQSGDMLAAIQHALNLDFVGALDWDAEVPF